MKKKKILSLFMIAAMVVTSATGFASKVQAKAVIWSSDADVSWIDTSKPMVALTFDDGPVGTAKDATSQQILDTIEEYNAHGTFFYVGQNINSTTEDEIKRAYSLGCEIGNHSQTHSYLTDLTKEGIEAEINQTASALTKITGVKKFLVRPPYIATNALVADNITSPMISASVDSSDWTGASTESIISNVLNNVQDGSIVLMHETMSTTAEAVKTIIPALVKRGYQLVTVSEMMKAKGITMKSGYMYISAGGYWPCTTDLEETTEPEDTSPAVTTIVPAETESPAVTTAVPAETESPAVTTAVPAETASPAVTIVVPAETESPAVTTIVPAETASPAVTTVVPAETASPAVTTPASQKLTGDFTVSSEWSDAYNVQFTVTNNTDKTVNGWKVQFSSADQIDNVWCAELVSSENHVYVMKNVSWNGTIAGGSSVSFGFTVKKNSSAVIVPNDIIVTEE